MAARAEGERRESARVGTGRELACWTLTTCYRGELLREQSRAQGRARPEWLSSGGRGPASLSQLRAARSRLCGVSHARARRSLHAHPTSLSLPAAAPSPSPPFSLRVGARVCMPPPSALSRWLTQEGVHLDPRIHLVSRPDGSTAVTSAAALISPGQTRKSFPSGRRLLCSRSMCGSLSDISAPCVRSRAHSPLARPLAPLVEPRTGSRQPARGGLARLICSCAATRRARRPRAVPREQVAVGDLPRALSGPRVRAHCLALAGRGTEVDSGDRARARVREDRRRRGALRPLCPSSGLQLTLLHPARRPS